MNFSLKLVVLVSLLPALSAGRQVTGSGTAAFFDSTAFCDAIRLTMTNVSTPAGGTEYVAWLAHDDDAQYTKLGTVSVSGGNVSLTYKDPSGNNLLSENKKLLISAETSPFAGSTPTLSTILWADSLHASGIPGPESPLTRLRNCLSTFSNTADNLGLALWLKIHIADYLSHAGFARDGAKNDNEGEAETHSDHIYDFILGRLLNSAHGSIADNDDPVGYGYRRYGDPGTKDSSQGGAGYLGGAGHYVKLIVNDPEASMQMKASGASALRALQNAFGTSNDSGWAKEVTDRAANIVNKVYVTGDLPTEGDPFYDLATRFLDGTVGAADTASETGGIRQAYYHLQQMAAFNLEPPAVSSAEIFPEEIPRFFALGPNFPNPFNAGTAIPFSLPVKSLVRIAIYDALGKEIALVVDNLEFSAGSHHVRWSEEGLASGVYYCRFQAVSSGDQLLFTDTRPLVFLK